MSLLYHAYGFDVEGNWLPLRVNATGGFVGFYEEGITEGTISRVEPWSYAAQSGGIFHTNNTTIAVAPGAGRSNYLTSLQICNTSSTATEVVVKSGSTILWRCLVGASMTSPARVEFQRPLISANNTALTVACITTGTATYIDAQGYTDKTVEQIQAAQTAENELFDALGVAITDAAGVIITVDGPQLPDVYPLVSGALTLIGSETDGVAMDFRDLSYVVRDTTTPGNALIGTNVNSWLTYTAPSTKWIRNSAGVLEGGTTIRKNHDVNGNVLGTRMEFASTNLLLHSSGLTQAAWTKSRCAITADTIIAPDGTLTGDLVVEDTTAAATHRVVQAITVTAGYAITCSQWLKAGTRTKARLVVSSNGEVNYGSATFDLIAGTVSNTLQNGTGAHLNSTIELWLNGWYRCSITATVDPAATSVLAGTFLIDASGGQSYDGDGVSGLYMWGAQVEQFSANLQNYVPSSYIPTTTATVTRAGDNIFRLDGFGTSNTEGTLFVEMSTRQGVVAATPIWRNLRLSDNTTANYVNLYRYINNFGRNVVTASVSQSDASVGPVVVGPMQVVRAAAAWALNDSHVAVNGTLGTLDTSLTPPTGLRRFDFGANGVVQFNGDVSRALYVPRRMTNPEIQALTT